MKVCVIGGGASGLMVAAQISDKGHEVVLVEKNAKLGKKIYITGKGRCNLTNCVTGGEFLANVVNNAKFFMSSEIRFNSQDTISYFEKLNVPLKIERGNRVFPVSDKASDITKALEKKLVRQSVKIMLEQEVVDIIVENNKACGVVLKNGNKLLADKVIVATGGLSYPLTGSTGDGYKFASKTGHRIINPVAGLVPLLSSDSSLHSLAGLSLKNVRLAAYDKSKLVHKTQIGEMLFTDKGISGPLALTLSSYINRFEPKNVKVCIDFKPALSDFALLERINRDIAELKSKQFSSLLSGLLPNALCDVFAKRLKINKTTKANQLTKIQRESLRDMLKNFEIYYNGLDNIACAVITSGGVCVKDLKPKSMESKLVEGLYFIGETVDIDALTGGFNLQVAFSTACACASDF